MDESPGANRIKKDARRTVWALGAAQLVDGGEGSIISTFFPSIERSLGLNVGHLGAILSIRRILGMITRPAWSVLADRYSRKAVLVWVTGIWGFWTFLAGFAQDYRQVLVLSILSGIGLTAYWGPRGSLIADMFPREERGKIFGATTAIASVGGVVGSFILGALAEVSDISWRVAYWLSGALSILSGALIWLLVDEPVRGQSEAALADTTGEIAIKLEAQHPFSFGKILGLFKIPTLLMIWLGGIPAGLLSISVVSFGATWLVTERGLSPGRATYTLGMMTIGLAVGGLVGGRIGDWADRRDPRNGRVLVGHLAKVITAIASFLLFQIEWQGHLGYWVLYLILGTSFQVSGSGAVAPMATAVTLPEIRATRGAVGTIVSGVINAAAYYVLGQIGARMGLTPTLSSVVIGSAAINVLNWFAYYYVYHRDAAKMQQVLAERRAALADDT